MKLCITTTTVNRKCNVSPGKVIQTHFVAGSYYSRCHQDHILPWWHTQRCTCTHGLPRWNITIHIVSNHSIWKPLNYKSNIQFNIQYSMNLASKLKATIKNFYLLFFVDSGSCEEVGEIFPKVWKILVWLKLMIIFNRSVNRPAPSLTVSLICTWHLLGDQQ